MISPGPHAFLIVLSAAHRFTAEEQKTIEYINEMFGSDAGKYCILIITREEDIFNDDKVVDQYLQEAGEPLKRLVAQCQNRYLAINNGASQTEHDDKIRQLIRIVRNMLKENKTPYYTNEMFERAEKEFREKETEALNLIKAQTEAKMRTLREEVQRDIQENMQNTLSRATYDLRNMQRDGVNNQQPTMTQWLLDFAARIVQTIGAAYIADVQNRPAIATGTDRDQRQYMIVHESMQSLSSATEFADFHRRYTVQGSGETGSDSD